MNDTINLKKEKERTIRDAWNVHDDLKGRSLQSLRTYQSTHSLPFAVCVVNLYGDLNVGIILRTAALTGAEKVFVFGRKKYDKRSTVGANKYLNVEFIDGMIDDYLVDPSAFHLALFENGYYPVFVEQGGTPLGEYDWYPPVKDMKPCLVFGNEGEGIPSTLMDPGSEIVSIEQLGVIRSYNVSSAASIVMYDLSQRLKKKQDLALKTQINSNRNQMMAF